MNAFDRAYLWNVWRVMGWRAAFRVLRRWNRQRKED